MQGVEAFFARTRAGAHKTVDAGLDIEPQDTSNSCVMPTLRSLSKFRNWGCFVIFIVNHTMEAWAVPGTRTPFGCAGIPTSSE